MFLAISDLLACAMMIPWPLLHMVASSKHWDLNYRFGWNFFLAHVSFVLVNGMMKTSTLLTCALTWDRYMALTFPLKYKTLSSLKIVGTIIGLCFVVSFSLMIPRTMRFMVIPMPEYKDSSNQALARYIQAGQPSTPLIGETDYEVFSTEMTTPFGDGLIHHKNFSSKSPTTSSLTQSPSKKKSPSPNFYFTLNTHYKDQHIVVIYDWIRELLLTVLPLIVIIFLNAQIIMKFRKIMRKKQQLGTNAACSTSSPNLGDNLNNKEDMSLRNNDTKMATDDKNDGGGVRGLDTQISSGNRYKLATPKIQLIKDDEGTTTYDNDNIFKSTNKFNLPFLKLLKAFKNVQNNGTGGHHGNFLSHLGYNPKGGPERYKGMRKSTFDTTDISMMAIDENGDEPYDEGIGDHNSLALPLQSRTPQDEVVLNSNLAGESDRCLNERPYHSNKSNINEELMPSGIKDGDREMLSASKNVNTQRTRTRFGITSNGNGTMLRSLDTVSSNDLNHGDHITPEDNKDKQRKSSVWQDRMKRLMNGSITKSMSNYSRQSSSDKSTSKATAAAVAEQRRVMSLAKRKKAKYERDEKRLTSMLISLAMQYFVCCVPQAVTALVDNPHLRQLSWFRVIIIVTNVLEALNYMLNFYVYLVFVKDFPKHTKKILVNILERLGKMKKHQKSRSQGSTTGRKKDGSFKNDSVTVGTEVKKFSSFCRTVTPPTRKNDDDETNIK